MTTVRRFLLLAALNAIAVGPVFAGAPHAGVTKEPGRGTFRPLHPQEAKTQTPTIPTLAPQVDLTPFVGLTIRGIDVRVHALDDGAKMESPRLFSVAAGGLFDVGVPSKLISELENTGRFARVVVKVEVDGDGVRVVVVASARGIVDHISVSIDDDAIDRETIAREFALTPGADFEADEWRAAADRVRRFLLRSGFPDAKLDTSLKTGLLSQRFILGLAVRAGKPTLLAKRYFYSVGAPAAVIDKIYEKYAARTGDRVDEAALAGADAKLENQLRGAKYFNARVTHDVGLYDGAVTLRVHIDTGARYELLMRGNSSIDNEALISSLELESDTADRNPAQFGERMATYYRKRGFSDVKVRSTTTGASTDPVRYVVLNVDEGVRAKVYSRSYPCLDLKEIGKLRGGGPSSTSDIGSEIDSFLEEELPNGDNLVHPHPVGADMLVRGEATKRAVPLELEAGKAFDAATYDRAMEHVQELYRNEGYLHARIGPFGVFRATCKPGSSAGGCDPIPLPAPPKNLCAYDQTGLPLPSPPFPDNLTCTPNSTKGVRCSSRLDVIIPIKLGPQSFLYDVAFVGARAFPHRQLGRVATLPFGEPVSLVTIENAVRKLTDFYRTEGYAFAEVKYAIEESDDHTRVRVRFDLSEGDLVYVRRIDIRGLNHTNESIVRRRITLRAGLPFRGDEARRTEEAIATLGPFTSVSVAMDEPSVVLREKTIIVTVIERTPQYIEVRPGFSFGEGFRAFVEYGHRNILGSAIGLTARGQVSYLPPQLVPGSVLEGFRQVCPDLSPSQRISDPAVRYPSQLSASQVRECDFVGRRATLSLLLPEIGLGSRMRGQIDLIHARDIQRDFVLQKFSALVTLNYRPVKNVMLSVTPSIEHNTAIVYRNKSVEDYLIELQGSADPTVSASAATLGRLLRVPTGQSLTFAVRTLLSWDRRDDPFNAHRGTYFATGVEFVNWHSLENADPNDPTSQGQFFRLTQTASAYLPFSKKVTLAFQLRVGENVQLRPSQGTTYPDRLFFMGGFDSMRGWLQDSLVPYEFDKQLVEKTNGLTLNQIATRGGDFMFNPRVELRFPIRSPFDAVVFGDFGNLWREASNVFEMPFKLRAAAGVGIRWVTPVGPLVLDYGFNLTHREYEGPDPGALQFAIGLF